MIQSVLDSIVNSVKNFDNIKVWLRSSKEGLTHNMCRQVCTTEKMKEKING